MGVQNGRSAQECVFIAVALPRRELGASDAVADRRRLPRARPQRHRRPARTRGFLALVRRVVRQTAERHYRPTRKQAPRSVRLAAIRASAAVFALDHRPRTHSRRRRHPALRSKRWCVGTDHGGACRIGRCLHAVVSRTAAKLDPRSRPQRRRALHRRVRAVPRRRELRFDAGDGAFAAPLASAS